MIEAIEQWLYSPPVRNFVFAHPYLTWALLAAVLSSLILVPVLWTWPKKKSK
jgi:hypothetical protein